MREIHVDEIRDQVAQICVEAAYNLSDDVLTAFEVLEHLADPRSTKAEWAKAAPATIVTTCLLPDPAPKPGEWWYYSLLTGQHVIFYTPKALGILADATGRRDSGHRSGGRRAACRSR